LQCAGEAKAQAKSTAKISKRTSHSIPVLTLLANAPSEAAARQALTLTLIPFIDLTNVTGKFRVRVRVWLCAGRAEREAGAMANLLCSRRDCSFDSRSAICPLRHGTSLALIRAWIDCFVSGSFCKVVSRRGGLLPRFSLSDLALGKSCTHFFLR
jgi:hypothetical protein